MTERADTRTLKDLRWLLGLLTLAVIIMYFVGIAANPALHPSPTLVIFTILVIMHLILHWLLIRIPPRPIWINAYVVIQGILFFAIALISRNPNLIFTLFAGLLGEAIGTLGLNQRGILATLYFTLLLLASFFVAFDRTVSPWMFIGTLAIVVSSVLYTVLYKRQAEARQQAQSLLLDLEVANTQLRDYAAQVETLTTLAERQRMARELHDTLAQGLAGLSLQLEAVEAHLIGNRPHRALNIVQQARVKVRETLADSRAAIKDLRQPGRMDLGAALRQEVESFRESTGIACEVEINLEEDISGLLAETVSRIVAEGLTNIARHARAGHAKLRVSSHRIHGEVQIEIEDDGIGFEPLAVETGHYGLLGLRERARLLGGNFDVQSSLGEGTRLVIRLPLKETAHV